MRAAAVVVLAVVAALALPLGESRAATLPDVEDEVMCVTCGVPLNIAESPQADRQRAFIRRLADEGRSKDQIKDALVAEYGRRVLAMPEREGFGLAAYLVPLVFVGALVAALALLLPRWRRRRPVAAAAPGGPALSSADEQRLDAELARMDR